VGGPSGLVNQAGGGVQRNLGRRDDQAAAAADEKVGKDDPAGEEEQGGDLGALEEDKVGGDEDQQPHQHEPARPGASLPGQDVD